MRVAAASRWGLSPNYSPSRLARLCRGRAEASKGAGVIASRRLAIIPAPSAIKRFNSNLTPIPIRIDAKLRSAVLVERADQILGDRVRGTSLDLPPLEHEDHLAVLHQRDLRRRRRIAGEIAASARSSIRVLAGEHGGELIGLGAVLQRHRDGRARHPRGTTADGIHDHERRTLRILELRVDFVGRAELLHAKSRELFTHGGYEALVVHRSVGEISHQSLILDVAITHERENRALRNHEIGVAFEGDLDGSFAEKQGVVACARLHGNESGFPQRSSPRLVATLAWVRHRKAGPGCDDLPALHCLAVHRGWWQIQADLGSLLAFLEANQHTVADDDQTLIVLLHWCRA